MEAVLLSAFIYLAIGNLVALTIWEPEMDGWFWTILFWPLALGARL